MEIVGTNEGELVMTHDFKVISHPNLANVLGTFLVVFYKRSRFNPSIIMNSYPN